MWYAKDVQLLKYRQLYTKKPSPIGNPKSKYDQLEELSGTRRPLTEEEKTGERPLPDRARIYRLDKIQRQGPANQDKPFQFEATNYRPSDDSHWKATYPHGM